MAIPGDDDPQCSHVRTFGPFLVSAYSLIQHARNDLGFLGNSLHLGLLACLSPLYDYVRAHRGPERYHDGFSTGRSQPVDDDASVDCKSFR